MSLIPIINSTIRELSLSPSRPLNTHSSANPNGTTDATNFSMTLKLRISGNPLETSLVNNILAIAALKKANAFPSYSPDYLNRFTK